MGILKADRFNPMLFIGLGGSGGRVVDAMARKLTHHPNWQRIRELCHFMVIDTNQADLATLKHVPQASRKLISAFDRQAYVARKRGQRELDEDERVTQWVHDDYRFRSARGAGAGQIRVESRLGLFYNLEGDRARIRQGLVRMLDRATAPGNPYRDDENRVVHCLIYGSIAGGTGSGSFLPLAYLLQDVVGDHGWGRPNVVANLMLPSVFLNDVEQILHQDINANSYAALKELEHLTRLGYEGLAENETFHYDPTRPERSRVERRPFNLAYLIDKPAELSVERYTAAISDSSFLQIFSPFLGAQTGEYDNYDKHQKSLALGHFTVHYGSFGSAVLHFPRRDVLAYGVMRYVARAFDQYLCFGDDPAFRVDWEDPRFQLLSPAEQARQVDEKYTAWVQHKARLEDEQDLEGVFSGIVKQQAPSGEGLRVLFQRKLAELYDKLDELIQIEPFDDTQVNEESTSLSRTVDLLRRDLAGSRAKVMGQYLRSVQADVRTDRLLGDFFKRNDVDPLAQRYFLIALKGEGRLGPFEEPEEAAFLFELKENTQGLDSEHVGLEVSDLERALVAAADRGLLGMFSRENKRFKAAKRRVQDFFDSLEGANRDWIKASFWQAFHEELLSAIEARLTSFRDVASLSAEVTSQLGDRAARFAADPASISEEAASTEYYLDLEVFRDDRAEKRLWERFFLHRLDRHENYDEKEIFEVITESFKPAEERGRLRRKDAREIVEDIRSGLDSLGRTTFERAIADMGDLDLAGALELEARYVLAGPTETNDDVLRAIDAGDVHNYVRDKVARAVENCVLLANIDRSRFDDPTVVPNTVFYVGMAGRYRSEERTSLGRLTAQVVGEARFVDGWEEEDSVVFYRALLGVPLYFYSRVTGELYHDYRRVMARENRSYPLHIDQNWETLPNLDPVEIRQAEEKRRKQEAAAAARAAKLAGLAVFSLSLRLGNVVHDDDGYAWTIGGASRHLAERREDAFTAFTQLDRRLYEKLEKLVEDTLAQRSSSRKARRELVADLGRWRDTLEGLHFGAIADEDDRLKDFLDQEMEALDGRIQALSGDA